MSEPVTTQQVLARYQGRPIYLHEVSGNNGDELILKGSETIIRRAGCEPTGSPDHAEVLLINGGFKSDFWPFANETIRQFSQRFPTKHLIILPSSFLFESTDFPDLFAGRTAPATIIARERPSLDILRAMSFSHEVEFGLDHDTAFALANEPWVRKLAGTEPDRDALIVERGDAESPTGMTEKDLMASPLLRRTVTAVLPRGAALAGARMVSRLRGSGKVQAPSPFVSLAAEAAAGYLGRPVETRLVSDISRRSAGTFESFCQEIARSRFVVSTRLHVAILSAILGRRTYIVAGSAHKIPGIYEFSMKHMDHVSMVDKDCRVIG